ncbi:MAG: peptide chain release factor N(5)-glutamine methyltransferase [Candidatus Omnitrophica bacterium]|nr:peptide chain release factor N(5)-glutamine methyltransferase [Candidatus Omnitrophota bacterium]
MCDDELFLTAILNCSRSELLLHPVSLTDEQTKRLDEMRQRLAAGEPVQYICGFTEFIGHRIEVGPGVLIPRPETEVLVDAVIKDLKAIVRQDLLVLDIGTGSGCIPISLAKEFKLSRMTGVDMSAEALAFARRNARLNGVADRIDFIQKDIFWFLDETDQRFDAVISNPPYIPTAILPSLPPDVRCEPALALDGGPDGLHFYRFIIPAARRLLKPGGLLALEFGDGQRKELENLFVITGGWDKISIIKDNAGKSRIALAQKQDQ